MLGTYYMLFEPVSKCEKRLYVRLHLERMFHEAVQNGVGECLTVLHGQLAHVQSLEEQQHDGDGAGMIRPHATNIKGYNSAHFIKLMMFDPPEQSDAHVMMATIAISAELREYVILKIAFT